MASFQEHIEQAKKNLLFLGKINKECNDHWDWQVTTCFYTAVHLVNAHIAAKANLHYRTHSEVKLALNPAVQISATKVGEVEYTSYVKLMNLSRRARYLCHDSPTNLTIDGQFTHDVHLHKALKNLDKLIKFICDEYQIEIDKSSIICIPLKHTDAEYFSKS